MKTNNLNFRVWSKEDNTMYDADFLITNNGLLRKSDFEKSIIQICSFDDYELNVWIGGYDRNGKQIFIGDIVEYMQEKYIVSYHQFQIILNQVNKSNYISPHDTLDARKEYGVYHFKNIEVIGNIYENKDLLK